MTWRLAASLLSLWSILLLPTRIVSERIYENVEFTAERCKELGYDHHFDVCAVMVFCVQQLDRKLEDWESDDKLFAKDDEEELGSTESVTADQAGVEFANEVFEAEMKTEGAPNLNDQDADEVEEAVANSSPKESYLDPSLNQATYGWRVQGSTSCSWPGPILRLKRGLNHGLFVKGGDEPTNLHFHGLHIPGYGNGDDMYRSVEGDNVMIYRINLPADKHHGGTHWYHSHLHGASWDQVKGGAFGMIVIDDNGHDVGTQDQHVLSFLENEKILVIDNTHNDESFTANGLPQEVFHFVQNEWYRLRILAVNVESHYSQETIEFSDSCQVYPIAHDGIFRFQVPASEPRNTFILTVSSRLDVAIQCSQDAEIKVDRSSLVTIKVDMSRQPSDATPFEAGTDPWQSSRLEYTKDLRALQPDNSWKIRVDETNINHISQAQRKPLCDDDGNDFEYGTVQTWELRGVATHPFHVHTYPMQIASDDCGDGHEPGEFYDTIVTEGSGSIAHPCIVRLHLVDVAGPTVVHCHIFEHAEHGALAYFNVLSGPDEDDAMEPTCVKGNTCVDSDPLPKCSGLERQLRKRWL